MDKPTITVSDIASMVSIIEVAATRGSIKADELAPVGELYNRLKKFLEFAQQQIEPQSQGEQNA